MKTVTTKKEFKEIQDLLQDFEDIYLIGCGSCATQCKTGGKDEVLQMKRLLEEIGKRVTGWMVIPTTCDELTKYALESEHLKIKEADALLVLSCAFGVQTVCEHTDKPVFPGLDTLFVGKESKAGELVEICRQCGQCVLGETAGICPIVSCHKGLLHGPCGGMDKGKCEVDKERDCAWVLIYNRLKAQKRLGAYEKISDPKDYQKVLRPGRLNVKG